MSDTGVWTPWKEDVEMNEEISKRFDRIDDVHGKIFSLVRDTNERLSEHLIADGSSKENHKQRIEVLEKANEARKGWSSNIIIAAIAATFGAVAGYFSDFFRGKP